MGIKNWVRNFLKPMKKPFADADKKDASGEVKVGESAWSVASRRWKLYKSAALRRAGIATRKGMWYNTTRTFTTRRIPKPCSYSGAGAGALRRKRRALSAA